MTRLATRFVVLSTAGLLLSGCLVSGKDEDSPDKRNYVAMGDSYAAAPGVGRANPPLGCRKSKDNYPHKLADAADLDLTDVTCSGAPTEAVMTAYNALGDEVAPQIEAVDEDTDIVTIGLGFNDLGLSLKVFVACVQVTTRNPGATSPCTDADRNLGANGTQAILDQVTDRLKVVVEEVTERAPDARVFLVGYPTIFPTGATCPNLGMNAGDMPLMNHIVSSLNTSLKDAAAAYDATYVDLATPTAGHDVCSDDPWVAGLQPVGGRKAMSWHPYEDEQELAADTLAKLIGSD